MNESWGWTPPWRRLRKAQLGFAVVLLVLLVAVLRWRLGDNWEAIGALLVVLGGALQLLLSSGPPLPDPRALVTETRSPVHLNAREISHVRNRIDREVNTWIDLVLLMSFACVIFGGGLVFLLAL